MDMHGFTQVGVRGSLERDISSLRTMGWGSGQMEKSSALRSRRRRHLEVQVDIQTGKIYLEVLLWFWGRGERYLRKETGVYREF